MSIVLLEKEYRCIDDCRQEGCPSHKAQNPCYRLPFQDNALGGLCKTHNLYYVREIRTRKNQT